jgi:hypothetical protein
LGTSATALEAPVARRLNSSAPSIRDKLRGSIIWRAGAISEVVLARNIVPGMHFIA